MNFQAIVTVKLPDDPKHDPNGKIAGACPLNNGNQCLDVTGAHHSFLIEYPDYFGAIYDLKRDMEKMYGHVTRIEVVGGLKK